MAPSAEFVSTLVQQNTTKYSESTELNRYGARFKYSKFLSVIDDSSDAVTSNITTIQMRRDLRVALNSFAEYQIGFGNEFYIKSMDGYNIKTSAFRTTDSTEDVYLSDLPNTNRETGSLFLFTLPNAGSTNPTIIKRNVGNINYKKGIITINPINIITIHTLNIKLISKPNLVFSKRIKSNTKVSSHLNGCNIRCNCFTTVINDR